MTATGHPVASLAELPDGTARKVVVDGTPVCLVRCGEQVHAIGDVCTHQDISLSEGEIDLDECTVECWKHGSAFSLTTGEPLSLPATGPVPVYPVIVDGDQISIVLDGEGGGP